MSSQSMLDRKKFWDVIRYLVQMDRTKNFDDICKDLSITKNQLNSFIHFLKEVECHLNVHSNDGNRQVDPLESEPTITLEFNLLEWLQFQACFPKISENEGRPFYAEIKDKLCEAEKKFSEHDIFGPSSKLEAVLDLGTPQIAGSDQALLNEMVSFLEDSILDEKTIRLNFNDGNTMSVFPRKVVFLDGHLSLVGEATGDRCLMNVGVSDIQSASEEDHVWNKMFSRIEIDDFISSIRAVNDNEVRLVLKIFSRERFTSNLKRHFFGNQCMVTNPQGEFIWAGSVEPNEQIFQWLEDLGSDVEILDPVSFKKEFLKYCEAKLKKLA